MNIGTDNKVRNWKEYYSALCSRQQNEFQFASRISKFVRTASTAITEAWAKCSREGLSVVATSGEDPSIFGIELRFRAGPGQIDKLVIDEVNGFLVGPPEVRCEVDLSSSDSRTLPTGELTFFCTRPPESEARIAFNTDKGSTSTTIRALPPPPPLPIFVIPPPRPKLCTVGGWAMTLLVKEQGNEFIAYASFWPVVQFFYTATDVQRAELYRSGEKLIEVLVTDISWPVGENLAINMAYNRSYYGKTVGHVVKPIGEPRGAGAYYENQFTDALFENAEYEVICIASDGYSTRNSVEKKVQFKTCLGPCTRTQ